MSRSCLLIVSAAIFVIAACETPAPAVAQPSAHECPTTGARQCKNAEECGPELHCTGGSCFANQIACPCSESTDCGSIGHCAKGICYANAAGVPCSGAPNECGSHAHCTGGGCYANNTGSPCSSSADCGPSSSCVAGTCN